MAYAPNRMNISVNEKLASAPAIAVVAGVSAEQGLEAWLTFPRSIDSDTFISFLESLLAANNCKKIALLVDNVSTHRSK